MIMMTMPNPIMTEVNVPDTLQAVTSNSENGSNPSMDAKRPKIIFRNMYLARHPMPVNNAPLIIIFTPYSHPYRAIIDFIKDGR